MMNPSSSPSLAQTERLHVMDSDELLTLMPEWAKNPAYSSLKDYAASLQISPAGQKVILKIVQAAVNLYGLLRLEEMEFLLAQYVPDLAEKIEIQSLAAAMDTDPGSPVQLLVLAPDNQSDQVWMALAPRRLQTETSAQTREMMTALITVADTCQPALLNRKEFLRFADPSHTQAIPERMALISLLKKYGLSPAQGAACADYLDCTMRNALDAPLPLSARHAIWHLDPASRSQIQSAMLSLMLHVPSWAVRGHTIARQKQVTGEHAARMYARALENGSQKQADFWKEKMEMISSMPDTRAHNLGDVAEFLIAFIEK